MTMHLATGRRSALSRAALVLLMSACGSGIGGGPADGNAGASGNAPSGGDRGSGGTSGGGVSAKGGELGNQGGNRANGGTGGNNAGGDANGGSAHGGANPGGSAGERTTSGGVGGANRGGAGGSSGAAGSNTGGAGGAAGSACPSAAPSVGEACAADGLDCAWGDSPFPECRTHLVCSLGKWAKGFSGSECTPTAADVCPPVEPNRSGVCTTDDVGARCSYDGGSLCTCESQACGGTGCTPLAMPTWFCYRPPSNCPFAAPNAGTECNGSMTCNYEYCGLTASCRNGRWTWLFGCA